MMQPLRPCIILNSTICSMEVAKPQSTELAVNIETETMYTFFAPNRMANHPEGSVMIAEATIYEVKTQAI